jgi:polyhydroxybutyrate depolymerase
MVYAARRYRIPAAWPQAIVVYPQGLPTMTSLDPKGSNNGWEVRASESNKDVQFFDEMLKSIENKYKVNKSKIFVMGHSNGGFFSYTLWALRANEIAGFGVFEGSKFLGVNLTVPKPLFVTIGDQDPLVPPKKQRDSMQAAIDLDGGSSGTPAGANETLFKGKQPVMLWAYHGGHDFQRDAVQPMVDFWKKL